MFISVLIVIECCLQTRSNMRAQISAMSKLRCTKQSCQAWSGLAKATQGMKKLPVDPDGDTVHPHLLISRSLYHSRSVMMISFKFVYTFLFRDAANRQEYIPTLMIA